MTRVLVFLGLAWGAVLVGILIAFALLEVSWRIRARRARRAGVVDVDLVGVRPS